MKRATGEIRGTYGQQYGVEVSATRVVLALWEQRPYFGVRQALVLAIAWTH